jgi:hypothetical protein
MIGNCIIARSTWCKVSVISFRMDTPSKNKTNKFIPYHHDHWIISKHKYCGIKFYIVYDFFINALYILWRFNTFSIASRIVRYKIHPIFLQIENRVTWKIKWSMYHCCAYMYYKLTLIWENNLTLYILY